MNSQTFEKPTYFKRWRSAAAVSAVLLVAALGSYMAGQYKIGRLDEVVSQYNEPISDYAAEIGKTETGSVEYELLNSCKQAQIGTWLQTTDALIFKDPISGNRVLVQLEAGKDFIDLNGKELVACISDEIENRQFNISSMSNSWALILMVLGVIAGAVALMFRRRMLDGIFGSEDEDTVETSSSAPVQDAVIVADLSDKPADK